MTLEIECVECVDQLNRLADNPAYANRASDLKSLANAVDKAENDDWTGIDLIDAFPAHTAVTVAHKSPAEKWFGALAGVSVFLPVAWTWWSFRAASSAYDAVLTAGTDAGQTFLALWTSGFGGQLWVPHQLVPMAAVSIALILAAMVLIIAHRVAAQMNVVKEEKQTTDAQNQLVATLIKAQRCLNKRRTDDPNYIATMLRKSVRELRDAQNDLKNSTAALTKATTEVSGELKPMLVEATNAAQELKSAATAAKDASTDLAKSVDKLTDGVSKSVGDLESGIDRHVTSLRDTTANSLSQLADRTSTAVKDLNAGAAGAVSGIGVDITKLRETVERILQASQAAGTGVELSVDQLSDLLRRLDEALQRTDSALQAQQTEITQANDHAARLLRHLEQYFPPNGGSTGGQP